MSNTFEASHENSSRFSIPRIYAHLPLQAGALVDLPAVATRHVQVLRMQPGQQLTLFNGQGGQWATTITHMGKNRVEVQIDAHHAIEREAQTAVTLLVGIPVNERMDFLIEKATELGVTEIYPMMFERSVFKLNAMRAEKKLAQWQAIVISACEQCGRNTLPVIHPVSSVQQLLQSKLTHLPVDRRMLSLENALPWPAHSTQDSVCVLSGPEGGLSQQEELLFTTQADFKPYSLGARTLRADTAPIAALSALTIA